VINIFVNELDSVISPSHVTPEFDASTCLQGLGVTLALPDLLDRVMQGFRDKA